jgi:hypothetical protein
MTALLLAFLLIQASPAPKGFATGLVRSANGAPAPGVRVYAIPAGDPNSASTDAIVFESLAQTDASGRYRLEIPAGRYYIAVGSVTAPTYYPDTASIASAKPISIAAGTTVESVDFSRYTAAASSARGGSVIQQPTLLAGATGVLSGIVRNFDGSIATGISVAALPVSILNRSVTGPVSSIFYGTGGNQRVLIYQTSAIAGGQATLTGGLAVTDNQGRYQIERVAPGLYNIIAGYANSPTFYPGGPGGNDIQKAIAITTTPTTLLATLDITLPPPPTSVSIRGRVSANDTQPLGGATMGLSSLDYGIRTPALSVLPLRISKVVITGGDGTFEIPDVIPGKYALQALVSGTTRLTKTVEVADAPLNINFDFSINVVSGHIVWEDGSPFSDPAIGPVALSTISNPNFISTTLLSVSNNGAFSGVIDPGDYRFYIRSLPAGYLVRSMTMGSVDLAKDSLHVGGDAPNTVEIRVARKLNSGARVRGRIMDATTGAPPVADHLELCCFDTGPFERLSAAILPDGSFDFPDVPPGRYTADLRKNSVQTTVGILNRSIEIGDQEKSGMLLVSATQLTSVSAVVTLEDGSNLPANAAVKLALLISPGTSRGTTPPNGAPAADVTSIPMGRLRDGTFWIPFPSGVLYTTSVENLPEGYRIKSISDLGANGALPAAAAAGGITNSGFAPGTISIVLERTPTK